MQRIFLVLLCLFGSALAVSSAPHSSAQQSTPPPATPMASFDLFVGFPSERAPGQTVYVVRFTLQPGGDVPGHSHPGTTMLAVESGRLGYTLLQGTAHVIRRGTAAEEISNAGTEVILEEGDAIYYEDDVAHSARNAGDEPVKVMAVHILETGQPMQLPAATPTP